MRDSEWQRVIKRMNTNESKENRVILFFKRNKMPIWLLNNFIQFSMQCKTTITRSRSQMFFEIGFLKVCNIHRKTHVLEFFLVKLQAWRPVTLLRRYCNTYVFLWILRSFKKLSFKEHQRWLLLYFKINREFDDIYKSGNWWHILSI